MKFRTIISLLALLIPFCINYAQPMDTLWTKTITAAPAGYAISNKMVKESDSTFICAGSYADSLYLVKINKDGEIIWQRYLYAVDKSLSCADIDRDVSGNLYTVVWDYYSITWWQVIKFTPEGDSIWSYTVDDQVSSVNRAQSIVVNSNSIYAVAAAWNGSQDYTLWKFNEAGGLIYTRDYQIPGNYNMPHSVITDYDGNVILAGEGGTEPGGCILKCNSDGDTLWSRTIDTLRIQSALADSENNIIVTGSDDRILKYDPDGNVLFDRKLGNYKWLGSCLISYKEGNVLLVGSQRRSGPGYSYDILVGKYSGSSGDSLWNYVYNYPEPVYGATGEDGVLFGDTLLIVLSHCFFDGYYDSIFLTAFPLADGYVPVELSSFTSETDGENVILRWTTGSETNNKGFVVERESGISALPGREKGEWAAVGFVEGNGTSPNEHSYTFTDKNLTPATYHYRLKQTDFDGSFAYSNEVEAVINLTGEFRLEQNYPNPFNPVTTISYSVPHECKVKMKIYDMLGNEIVTLINEKKEAGSYEVKFNGSSLASGVYIYRLTGGSFSASRKFVLMK